MTPRCEYPGCPDTASRKFPEMVVRAGRGCCIFRLFCAAHIPEDVMHMSAPLRSEPPTHASPKGQVHVPRVWEITGKGGTERQRRQARAWSSAPR